MSLGSLLRHCKHVVSSHQRLFVQDMTNRAAAKLQPICRLILTNVHDSTCVQDAGHADRLWESWSLSVYRHRIDLVYSRLEMGHGLPWI